MARRVRIEFAGAFYHVMAKGHRGEAIYQDDEDRIHFLKTLGDTCARTGWRVHAWVLMSNHYHLLIETPEPNLVVGMQWLQNTITRRWNTRHQISGCLFGDRYKAVLVEGESEFHYESLLDYIHLNPVRAGIIKPARRESVLDYQWSSLAAGYAVPMSRRPKWLAVEQALGRLGWHDSTAGRRQHVNRLDRRAGEEGMERAGLPVVAEETDRRCSHLGRGWYWGSQAFADRLLKRGELTLRRVRHRSSKASQEQRAHGLREANRLLTRGMAAFGLEQRELTQLAGSETRKVALARLLWENTTVSMQWIAGHLCMKSAANASQQIRRSRRENRELPQALRRLVLSRNVA